MNTQTKEFTSNKDIGEFISSIELISVRSVVTNKFINLDCNQSQASNATTVLHQLILLNESVKSVIKVQGILQLQAKFGNADFQTLIKLHFN